MGGTQNVSSACSSASPRLRVRFGSRRSGLDFRIHRVNQRLDEAIAESISLKLAGIVGMRGHMVGADRAGKLHVPQNAHDLEKIHLSFIRVNFREIVESAADV